MKCFISYRFTGETQEDLKNLLEPVKDALNKAGVEAYCNFFDEDLSVRSKNFKPKDYVFDAFSTLENCDLLFVLLKSSEKSEGMILEMGYALGKNIPSVVAVKEGIKDTYLPGMSYKSIIWKDVDDLLNKINKTDCKALR